MRIPVAVAVWNFFGSFLNKTSGSSATNSCLWENLAPQHSIMVRFFSVSQFFGTPCKHGDTENCCERWPPPAPPNAAGIPPVPGTFFIRLLVAISSPLFSAKTMVISIIIIYIILIFILILFPVTISRSIIIIIITICLSPSLFSANNWTRPNILQTPKTTVGGRADAEDQGILVFFLSSGSLFGHLPCLNDIYFVINVLIPASNLRTYDLIGN